MDDTLRPAPETLATLANLVYIDLAQPGLMRRRRGRGFSFYDCDGRLITDAAELERLKHLAIPPGWTNVWICSDPAGHIQVTGRDERGRKQYIYHPQWNAVRDEAKFGRLVPFAAALPDLRCRVESDLRRRALTWEKVVAIAVQLMDKTRLRVGNLEYERQNESFGLTTLKDDHVAIAGDRVTFAYRGKSGKDHSITLRDRRLARLVRQCQELPGQELFQYQDESGQWRVLRSTDVNLYLREATGQDFTAKDFRTWGGTVAVAEALYAIGPASTPRESKRSVTQAIRTAARGLGNTVAVCRKYYVHPAILAAYTAGTLAPTIEDARSHPVAGLEPIEAAVLALLRGHDAAAAGNEVKRR